MNTHYVIALTVLALGCDGQFTFKEIPHVNHALEVYFNDPKKGEIFICRLDIFGVEIQMRVRINGESKLYAKLVNQPGLVTTLSSYIVRCKDNAQEAFFKHFNLGNGLLMNVTVEDKTPVIDLNNEEISFQKLKAIRASYDASTNLVPTGLLWKGTIVPKELLDDAIKYTEATLFHLSKPT